MSAGARSGMLTRGGFSLRVDGVGSGVELVE